MAKKDLKNWLEKTEAPDTYGVYRFFDDNDEVIYVGKSVNLRRRMQQYLTPSRRKKNRKRRTIVASAVRAEFEVLVDEKAALLRENELIQSLKPKFNTAGAFSFLYPVIAASFSNRRLALVRTTTPGEYIQFQRYGAFRDRQLVKDMFASLEYLFSIVGHREPPARLKDIPRSDYTRRCAFREVQDDYWPLIQNFLSGKDAEFLRVLCDRLLSYPTALMQAEQVEVNLKTLREFFKCEANKLFVACQGMGREEFYVDQVERDALFIKADV